MKATKDIGIKTAWIHNGEEQNRCPFINLARENGIHIELLDSVSQLDNNKWDAVILDIVCRVRPNDEPAMSNVNKAIIRIRGLQLPVFLLSDGEEAISKLKECGVIDKSIKCHIRHKDPNLIWNDIKGVVSGMPTFEAKRKYSIEIKNPFFSQEDQKQISEILKMLHPSYEEKLQRDGTIPHNIRNILERIKALLNEYKIIEYSESEGKTLALNEWSRDYIRIDENIPDYIKQSIHTCTRLCNDGSHQRDDGVKNDIEHGKAPHLNKTLIYELLNILHWCASQK